MIKYLYLFVFLFLSGSIFAQFPNNPVKIRLGYQTTSKGLIYYGGGEPTTSPTGFMHDAFAYVDTLTNTIYLYDEPNDKWEFLADSVYHASTPSPAIMPLDSILIDTSFNNQDFDAGEMGWDETGAFRFGVLDNYSFAVGQDMYKEVHNTTGSQITIGTAVKMTGADGASNVFQIAPIDYPSTGSEFLLGIVAVNIPAGEYGIVVQNGYVKKIDVDAEGWSLGDVLYLSENVPGALTDTIGDVKVAAVTKAGSNGTIYVRPDFYATNEIQTLSIDSTGRVFNISISDGNTVTFEDTNTQLSEAQVVDIARDTGFLEVESDPVWISDSVNYSTKAYTDQAEQDAKDYADANDSDDQTLSFTSPNLSIENGNSVDISSISNWTIDGTNIYSDISNSLDSATYSFAAGTNAGSNRDMDYQIAIGRFAGENNTADYQNAVGANAGFNNTAVNQNAFGREAGYNNTGLSQNAFGFNTGRNNTAVNQNAFGGYAGFNNTGDNQNVFGFFAGFSNTAIYQNAFGFEAGRNNTGIYQSVFGFNTGRNNTGLYQNAFGREAGENNSGDYQNAFGFQTGRYNTVDNQNAFGYLAGENNSGNFQNAFGWEAGRYNTGLSQNAFGLSAGRFNQGDYNISIGQESGYSTVTTISNPGDFNTWLNYRAGYAITEGNHNIGIGREAGDIITDGDYNIYIGGFASASSSGVNNETVIGYNVTGNGDNTVTIGNSSVVDTYLKGILNIDDVTQDNTETDVLVLQLDGEVQSRTVTSINSENTLQSVTDEGATTTNTILVGTSGGIRTEIQAGQIKQYLETAEGTEQQVSSGTIWRGAANKIRRSYGNLSAESAIPGSGAAIEYKEWSGYNSADAGYVIGINREVESTGAFTSSGAAPMKMTYQFNNGTALQNLFELNSSQQVKIYGTPYMTNITEDNTETNVLVLQSDGEVQSRYIPNMESARNANATTSGTGTITVSHSLGVIPSVTITNASISPYVFSVSNVTTTSFTFKVFDMTGAAVTSTSVNFDYQLIIP